MPRADIERILRQLDALQQQVQQNATDLEAIPFEPATPVGNDLQTREGASCMFTNGSTVAIIGTDETAVVIKRENRDTSGVASLLLEFTLTNTQGRQFKTQHWYRECQVKPCGMFAALADAVTSAVEAFCASQVTCFQNLEFAYQSAGQAIFDLGTPTREKYENAVRYLALLPRTILANQHGWCGHTHPPINLEDNDHPRDHVCDCNNCTRHCECDQCNHRNCKQRGQRGRRLCGTCMQCANHCKCRDCEVCTIRTSQAPCETCEGCHDCCSCNRYDTVAVGFTNPPEPRFWEGVATKRMPIVRFAAAEMETAGVYRGKAAINLCRLKWGFGIVRDGSLPQNGFEINTAPASGDKLIEQVEEICAILNRSGGFVNAECGTHVHVDARDLDHMAMRRLILLYKKIEPALMMTQPKSRRTNHYCAPCGDTYVKAPEEAGNSPAKFKEVLDKVIYRTTNKAEIARHKTQKYAGDHVRHKALNLHSWFFRGTVEFRLHSGTINANKLIPWMALLCAIIDMAKQDSSAKIAKLKDASPSDSIATLVRIAPTLESQRYILNRIRAWNGVGVAMEGFNRLSSTMRKNIGLGWQARSKEDRG